MVSKATRYIGIWLLNNITKKYIFHIRTGLVHMHNRAELLYCVEIHSSWSTCIPFGQIPLSPHQNFTNNKMRLHWEPRKVASRQKWIACWWKLCTQTLEKNLSVTLCTLHMKTTDPIPLNHNHTQELWSVDPSNCVYSYDKWFQACYQNLTDISRGHPLWLEEQWSK